MCVHLMLKSLTELKTVFHILIFWWFLFIPTIVVNKNTCQIYVFDSTSYEDCNALM